MQPRIKPWHIQCIYLGHFTHPPPLTGVRKKNVSNVSVKESDQLSCKLMLAKSLCAAPNEATLTVLALVSGVYFNENRLKRSIGCTRSAR